MNKKSSKLTEKSSPMSMSVGSNVAYELKGPRLPNLIPKQTTVTRNGKTYQTTVYINPELPEEKARAGINTFKTEEVRKTLSEQVIANRLISQIINKIEDREKSGSFFRSIVEQTCSRVRIITPIDKKWVEENILTNPKTGKSVKAGDSLTLIHYAIKRLEGQMRTQPSRQVFEELHKLTTIQRAMRGAVAEVLFNSLNFNKHQQLSLVANFTKEVPSTAKQLAREAAKTLSNFTPISVLKSISLNFDYDQTGLRTSIHSNTIKLPKNITKKGLLTVYGQRIEQQNPNVSKSMQQLQQQMTPSHKIDLQTLDLRYSRNSIARVSPGRQPGLVRIPLDNSQDTGLLGSFTGALSTRRAFQALYKEDPILVQTVLGLMLGLRNSTSKPSTVSKTISQTSAIRSNGRSKSPRTNLTNLD